MMKVILMKPQIVWEILLLCRSGLGKPQTVMMPHQELYDLIKWQRFV